MQPALNIEQARFGGLLPGCDKADKRKAAALKGALRLPLVIRFQLAGQNPPAIIEGFVLKRLKHALLCHWSWRRGNILRTLPANGLHECQFRDPYRSPERAISPSWAKKKGG